MFRHESTEPQNLFTCSKSPHPYGEATHRIGLNLHHMPYRELHSECADGFVGYDPQTPLLLSAIFMRLERFSEVAD